MGVRVVGDGVGENVSSVFVGFRVGDLVGAGRGEQLSAKRQRDTFQLGTKSEIRVNELRRAFRRRSEYVGPYVKSPQRPSVAFRSEPGTRERLSHRTLLEKIK